MVLHQIEMGGCGVWKITKNGHYLTTAENLPYPQICLSASVHIAFFIALSDIRKPPKEPILWRLFCGRFRKRGPCPQKVGSKPERREVSAAASVGLERSPQGTKTVYKRTVQAQRDFLRGGAVLRPSGARLALTKPAGETDPNGEAAFCAEKCGEPQGFAATWCARLDSNQRSRLPARVLLPSGERPALTEVAAETSLERSPQGTKTLQSGRYQAVKEETQVYCGFRVHRTKLAPICKNCGSPCNAWAPTVFPVFGK